MQHDLTEYAAREKKLSTKFILVESKRNSSIGLDKSLALTQQGPHQDLRVIHFQQQKPRKKVLSQRLP